MNPLTNMKNVTKLSEREFHNNGKSSWHDQYRDSAWIFVGGLPYDLTEGDIICIFSQYGEIVNINLIRDKDTGKSKGFCFICYEDQRSTVLSVDNLNGIKVLNRTIRVDHVSNYKIPKDGKNTGEETKKLYNEGCAPKAVVPVVVDLESRRETIADQIQADLKLPKMLPNRIEIKREVDSESLVQVKIEPTTPQVKSKRDSGSEDKDGNNLEKRKKKKKKSKSKHDYSSESDSDHKKSKKRDKHDAAKKLKRRSRSRSKERQIGTSKSDDKRNTTSRSLNEYKYGNFRDNDKRKYSNFDKNKYDAYFR